MIFDAGSIYPALIKGQNLIDYCNLHIASRIHKTGVRAGSTATSTLLKSKYRTLCTIDRESLTSKMLAANIFSKNLKSLVGTCISEIFLSHRLFFI